MSNASPLNLCLLPVRAREQMPNVQLPDNYMAAKRALAECVNVDQVREIADKHSAIAHYAKQIKDDSLRHYAERIYLRAQRRLGELLNDVMDVSRSTTSARQKVADQLRVSPSRLQEASYIARIPAEDFENAVETNPPPSKSALIHAARKPGSTSPLREGPRLDGGWSEPYVRCCTIFSRFHDAIREAGYSKWPDAASLARSLQPDEADFIKRQAGQLIDWLDELDRHLDAVRSRKQE